MFSLTLNKVNNKQCQLNRKTKRIFLTVLVVLVLFCLIEKIYSLRHHGHGKKLKTPADDMRNRMSPIGLSHTTHTISHNSYSGNALSISPDQSNTDPVDPSHHLLQFPTFDNKTFPHFALGEYIASGFYKHIFHLKVCSDTVNPCTPMQNPTTSAPLVIKISGAKAGDEQYNKEAVMHMQAESKISANIRQRAVNFSVPVETYLDISPDHAFTFTSKDLLDSLSVTAKNETSVSGKQLWKEYEDMYANDFQFQATLSELTTDAPLSFSSHEDLVVYFQNVLRGVDVLHSFNLAHLDIKTFNVRTSHKGTALLADFGSCQDLSYRMNFVSVIPFVSRSLPPEYLVNVNLSSTVESYDSFATGIMLLDWLYFPCLLNSMWAYSPHLSPKEISRIRQQYARTLFMLHHVTFLSNGVDVRNVFSKDFLRHINRTRLASVHVAPHERSAVKKLQNCRTKTILTPNVKLESELLDLAMRLIAADPGRRITIREALKHPAMQQL